MKRTKKKPDLSIEKRKFASKRVWKIWDGSRLAEMTPGPILFFDDPALAGVTIEWYVGVEVHKLVLVVALYGRAGNTRVLGPILRETTAPADRIALWDLVAAFEPARFLMETTGVFHVPVAWELRERFPSAQVVVMNAYELSKYVQRTRKSDKVDATRLAQVASVGELLRRSIVPAPAEWVLREVARYREVQVSGVTRQKNRVKKVMSAFGWHWNLNFQTKSEVRFVEEFLAQERPLGEFMGACEDTLGEKGRETLAPWACVQLPPDAREHLLALLRDLRVFQEIEALAAARLETRSKAFPAAQVAVDHLTEFPGMGHLEAITLAAEISDVARFPDSGRFLVYAGIAPSGGTSGVQVVGAEDEKVVARDKPNPRSNRRLKGILTRVAVSILGTCGRTSREDDLYQYARNWKMRDVLPMRRVYKIAAKVGRKLFHVLQAGVAYDGEAEKGPEASKRGRERSRHARRRQAYRKAWQAQSIAEHTAEALMALLQERGLEVEALAAITTSTERVKRAGKESGVAGQPAAEGESE